MPEPEGIRGQAQVILIPEVDNAPYMLKEILEQPSTLEDTICYYEKRENHSVLKSVLHLLRSRNRVVIAASGSSRHAGMVASFMLSRISGLDITVVPSSEYAQLPQSIRVESALMTISQSGETSDTLHALQEANDLDCPTVALTNSTGSSISQQADIALLTPVGREIAIPATKSFTGQLLVLLLLALCDPAGTASSQELFSLAEGIATLPTRLSTHLPLWFQQTKTLSEEYRRTSSFFYLGSGVHAGIAAEGALKLKESAYRHAEAYNSGEIEHGPNALITQNMPIFLVEPSRQPDATQLQASSLSRRLEKQGARMIEIVSANPLDKDVVRSHQIAIEDDSPYLQAIFEVVPLQMFAYHSAAINNISMDRPRNLTKAVIL